MNGRDVVRLVLLSAPRRPIVTKHARRTSGVPLRVNCSCATRKQLRGPLLSVRECVAVCRLGIGYSQPSGSSALPDDAQQKAAPKRIGLDLTAADYSALEARWIDRGLADRAGAIDI